MNSETKKFFEQLAGASADEEFEPRLTRMDELADDGDPVEREESAADEEAESERDEPAAQEEEESFEEGEGQLAIDVYQKDNNIVVEAPIAGVGIDDLDIEISPESVTIKGKREQHERIEEKDFLYQECYWGKFSRSIILPQEINADHATATFKNGVLRIVLPKVNKQKTKKVKVRFE